MRAMIISGTWGKNAAKADAKTINAAIKQMPGNTRISIFNGGSTARLKAIMNLADEYDYLVWTPVFETGTTHIDPKNYTSRNTRILN